MHFAKIALLAMTASVAMIAPARAAQITIQGAIDLATRHEEPTDPSSPLFRIFSLPLGGLPGPVDVAPGDSLVLTTSLNGALTIPGSASSAFLADLFINQYPAQDVEVTTQFFRNGASVASFSGPGHFGTAALGYGASLPISQGATSDPLTFDSYTETFTFLNGNAFQVTGGEFRYAFGSLMGPVPEAPSWALMILGVGAAGAATRRRRRAMQAAPG